jgi:ribose transport system substrate-binding protein
MYEQWRSLRRPLLFLALGLAMAFTAACGGSSTSAASGGTSGSLSSGKAQAVLNTAFSGVTGDLPKVTAKPKAGVKLWVISCGQQSVGCVEPTNAALAAGKAAGWHTKVCDGKLNPSGWGACIRQAVSAKAEAIVTIGIDCPAVQGPLGEAKTAGVVTVASGGFDCDVVGGKKLYSAATKPLDGLSLTEYREKMGALQADYLIGKSRGEAQVLLVNFTDPIWGPMITKGFRKELKSCSGCSVVKQLDVSNQDIVNNTLGSKFSSALLAAPKANAIAFPIDGFLQAGIGQAITSSGRSENLTVVGNFGTAPNLDVIRDNGAQDGDVGYSAAQLSWASVDDAIRLLAGKPAASSAGVGLVGIDADHNLPATKGTSYTPPADFVKHYTTGWGRS